jgi:hypothetical protein
MARHTNFTTEDTADTEDTEDTEVEHFRNRTPPPWQEIVSQTLVRNGVSIALRLE